MGVHWFDQATRSISRLRLIAVPIASLASAYALAAATYVNNASAIGANDTIGWAAIGSDNQTLFNPTSAFSANGMRFRVSKPSAGNLRLGSESYNGNLGEICVQSLNSRSMVLEFDGNLAAVGAKVYVSTPNYATLTIRAYNSYGAMVLQTSETHIPGTNDPSKFMGVQATGEAIRSLEFSTDKGVISLGAVSMRAGVSAPPSRPSELANRPIAIDDSFSVYRNGSIFSSQANVLNNDVRCEAVKLVTPPAHAENFRLLPDGTFEYKPRRNFHGLDMFTYTGITSKGQESTPATVMVNVINIGSAPSFTAGDDQIVSEDSGPREVENWASQINSGVVDEGPQRLNFVCITDRKDLFAELPSITPEGHLRFTPATHASGIAKVLVWLRNDSVNANPGIAVSQPYNLAITIAPVPHRPMLELVQDQTVFEEENLSLRVKASMVDFGRVPEFRLIEAPEGVSLNRFTGDLSWTPKIGSAPGTYLVTLEAYDNSDPSLKSPMSFKVRVVRRFTPATLKPTAPIEVIPGQTVKLQLLTNAPEEARGSLSFLLGTSVVGATLNADTGEFSWTPQARDAGVSHTFFVSVYDRRISRLSSVETIVVTVRNPLTTDLEVNAPMKRKVTSSAKSKAKKGKVSGKRSSAKKARRSRH